MKKSFKFRRLPSTRVLKVQIGTWFNQKYCRFNVFFLNSQMKNSSKVSTYSMNWKIALNFEEYLPWESRRSRLAPISIRFFAISMFFNVPFWIVSENYLPRESWRSRLAPDSINFCAKWLNPISMARWRAVLYFQNNCEKTWITFMMSWFRHTYFRNPECPNLHLIQSIYPPYHYDHMKLPLEEEICSKCAITTCCWLVTKT